MPWYLWLLVVFLGVFAAALFAGFVYWIFTRVQVTLLELVGTLVVAMLSTTVIYHIFRSLGYFDKGLSPTGAVTLMLPGFLLALFASSLGWREIKDDGITDTRGRLKVLMMYWMCLLGSSLIPLTLPLLLGSQR